MKNIVIMMALKRIVATGALLVVGCGMPAGDDCAHRLSHNEPLPATGCCTDDGFCVSPPTYDLVYCSNLSRADCDPHIYPPRFEGGEPWTFCPHKPGSDLPQEPCPLSSLAP